MTLGPMIALLPLAERARGWIAEVLATFGRVPMFYYLLHIPLIHCNGRRRLAPARRQCRMRSGLQPRRSCRCRRISGGDFRCSYLVFAVDVAILYVPCRWFAQVKARRRQRWLRYL